MSPTAVGRRWLGGLAGLWLLSVATTTQAGWWQDVAQMGRSVAQDIEAQLAGPAHYPAPAPVANDPMLIFAKAARWQLDWLQEPVFGAEIAVLDSGPSPKPALLLVHGLGQLGMADWLPLLPILARDFRVLALDLPGFGRSALPAGDLSPANYGKLLHWLVAQYGLRSPHLVGHSMGGAIALQAAANVPNTFASLTLIDAAGILQRTAFVKAMATGPLGVDQLPVPFKAYGYGVADFAGALIERVNHLGDPQVLIKAPLLRELALGNSPTAKAALALSQADFSAQVAGLTLPVNLLWGAQDAVAPLRTGKMLRARIAHSALYVIADAGHVPMASHGQAVGEWLVAVLQQRVPDAPWLWLGHPGAPVQGDLVLDGCPAEPLSGRFGRLEIHNCRYAELIGLQADSLSVRNSVLLMEDVALASAGVALDAQESVLVATGLQIDSAEPLQVAGSRLDWAAARVSAPGPHFDIGDTSTLVFSLGQLCRADICKALHGSFRLQQRQW